MHLGPLCMQLRAPISFFLLFGANSSPEKVQHFLVSPNSIKIVPNGMFFGAATGSGVLLCWGRCTKTSTFLRDPPHPSQYWNFHLIDKIADFLHNKLFFLIAPRDLHYYWASAQPCAHRLRRYQHLFCLWECPKMGFFPKDRTYRAFFVLLHKRNFFSDGPRGIECIWELCARSWERQLAFIASGKAKNGVFSPLSTKSQTFYTINVFFW